MQRIVGPGDRPEKIGSSQQHVGVLRTHLEEPLTGCHEDFLHGVGDPHGGIEADDSRGTLERMGRPHHRLDRGR